MRRLGGFVAAAALVAGCGGGDDAAEPADPVEIARELAGSSAGTAPAPITAPASAVDGVSATTSPAAAEELPPPDPGAFEGANRLVNLWVGPGGTTQVVDVWARRTFTNGPVLLAEDVAFGDATDYFSAPANHSVVVVGADAGPDGLELAGIFNAADGEQITTVFTNEDDTSGTAVAPTVVERSSSGFGPPPEPPAEGTGLVYVYAANTWAFESALTLAVGSASFTVGDGSGTCTRQRIEDDGFAAAILGGTQNVQLELPPGPATLTLHPWPSFDGCAQPSVLDIPIEVRAGEAALVLVYSRAGQSVEALVLPMPLA